MNNGSGLSQCERISSNLSIDVFRSLVAFDVDYHLLTVEAQEKVIAAGVVFQRGVNDSFGLHNLCTCHGDKPPVLLEVRQNNRVQCAFIKVMFMLEQNRIMNGRST